MISILTINNQPAQLTTTEETELLQKAFGDAATDGNITFEEIEEFYSQLDHDSLSTREFSSLEGILAKHGFRPTPNEEIVVSWKDIGQTKEQVEEALESKGYTIKRTTKDGNEVYLPPFGQPHKPKVIITPSGACVLKRQGLRFKKPENPLEALLYIISPTSMIQAKGLVVRKSLIDQQRYQLLQSLEPYLSAYNDSVARQAMEARLYKIQGDLELLWYGESSQDTFRALDLSPMDIALSPEEKREMILELWRTVPERGFKKVLTEDIGDTELAHWSNSDSESLIEDQDDEIYRELYALFIENIIMESPWPCSTEELAEINANRQWGEPLELEQPSDELLAQYKETYADFKQLSQEEIWAQMEPFERAEYYRQQGQYEEAIEGYQQILRTADLGQLLTDDDNIFLPRKEVRVILRDRLSVCEFKLQEPTLPETQAVATEISDSERQMREDMRRAEQLCRAADYLMYGKILIYDLALKKIPPWHFGSEIEDVQDFYFRQENNITENTNPYDLYAEALDLYKKYATDSSDTETIEANLDIDTPVKTAAIADQGVAAIEILTGAQEISETPREIASYWEETRNICTNVLYANSPLETQNPNMAEVQNGYDTLMSFLAFAVAPEGQEIQNGSELISILKQSTPTPEILGALRYAELFASKLFDLTIAFEANLLLAQFSDTPEKKADFHMRAAQIAGQSGDLRNRAIQLQQVINISQDTDKIALAHQELAQMFFSVGEFEEGKEHLFTCLETPAQDHNILTRANLLAQLAVQEQNPIEKARLNELATKHYKQALRHDRHDKSAQLGLAWVAYEQGNGEAALKQLEKITAGDKIFDLNTDNLTSAAELYDFLGLQSRSVTLFEEALKREDETLIRLDHNNANIPSVISSQFIHANQATVIAMKLAVLLCKQGEFSEALKAVQAAMRYNPDNPDLTQGILSFVEQYQEDFIACDIMAVANIYYDGQNFNLAQPLYLQILEGSEQAETVPQTDNIHEEMHDIRQQPESVRANAACQLAQMYLEAEDPWKAASYTQQASELHADSETILSFYKQLYDMFKSKEDYGKANGCLKLAYETGHYDKVIYDHYALLCYRREEYETALSCYQATREYDPDDFLVSRNIGLLHNAMGNFKECHKYMFYTLGVYDRIITLLDCFDENGVKPEYREELSHFPPSLLALLPDFEITDQTPDNKRFSAVKENIEGLRQGAYDFIQESYIREKKGIPNEILARTPEEVFEADYQAFTSAIGMVTTESIAGYPVQDSSGDPYYRGDHFTTAYLLAFQDFVAQSSLAGISSHREEIATPSSIVMKK